MENIGTFNFTLLLVFKWFTIVFMDDTLILKLFYLICYNVQPAPVYNECEP